MALDTIPKQEGGKLKAVASGTLPSGQPVVVNADGTVSVVEETDVSQSIGTPVVFESANTQDISSAYDASAQKIVVAYRDFDNSNYGTAVVGTVSGATISFGSPVVFESDSISTTSVTYDSNAQKVVIAYSDIGNSSRGTAVVGTVSGTSISFGSPTVFETGSTPISSASYDANAQKVVIAYVDGSNSNYGKAVVGTVSGTSISFGSIVVFEAASTGFVSAVYDANSQKIVVAYQDSGNLNYGTAIVGTVSGTSISFGSAAVFESADSRDISSAYDANAQKVVMIYRDVGNSNYGTAVVGTVSGTSISFGTPTVFESAEASPTSAVYDTSAQKIVVAYRDRGNSDYGTAVVGTVSGTSISFGSPVVFNSASSLNISAAYDPNAQKVIISYKDNGNSGYGTSVVFQPAYTAINLTAENYIGISSGGAVADTGNATVDIVGTVNKEQSGLTAGQQYYVQTDGTLSETPADPSVLAGTAVSATNLLVKA